MCSNGVSKHSHGSIELDTAPRYFQQHSYIGLCSANNDFHLQTEKQASDLFQDSWMLSDLYMLKQLSRELERS